MTAASPPRAPALTDLKNELISLVGTVLDGTYRLDQLIGEGGMGAVFRGRHVMMKRDVAIKVLHPDLNRDPELVRRFDREAQSAARLNHPNCIHVSAYGTTESGMRYLVMQLLEGVELADLLLEPVEVPRVVEWSIQILRGLEHAHEKGVIHRDLKPQNIFLTRDRDGSQLLKLVDFGIAKIVGGEGAGDPLTRAGMVFGTPQYMSPEQALGQDIDARADVYAVGVLMFQMLTGRLPFNHEDAIALIRMQVSAEPPPLPDTVPQELAAIVFRLLAKQPDQRFPDARTVRVALERYLSSLSPKHKANTALIDVVTPGSLSRPLPEALRPRRITHIDGFFSDPRLILKLAAALVLLLSLALVAYLFLSSDPPPALPELTPPAPAKQDLPLATGPTVQELATLDTHIIGGALDEAQAQVDALLERYPGNSLLVWRDARQLGKRPGMREAALRRYNEALKKSPELSLDLAFTAELATLLREPPITDPSILLARDLGPAGGPVLLAFLDDPTLSANLLLRHKVTAILAASPAAAQVDQVRQRRLDLEQHTQLPDHCAGLLDALTAIQPEPHLDYVPALKALTLTPGPSPACSQAAVLFASVRADHVARFPDAFAAPKPPKRKPKKKRPR